jgi:serine/threonine-protein kinase
MSADAAPASAQRYAEALRIAHALLDQPPAARAGELERACAGDAALRADVEWMLRAAEDDTGEYAADAAGASAPRFDGAALAAVAPPEYRILHPLGEGGAGMVYLAERGEAGVRQRVALKLLRHSAANGLERFRAEQRILAGLRHPNIAHFIDGGVLANGQPYLAVEYVDGVTIDRWCARQPLAARVDAFLAVCAAVSHAHAQLVIHRDLKPANILVDTDGVPKLLDFGIARLLGDDPALARTATRALTPVYASPEQVHGEPLGTATDVYSLGAVLYELATGVRPYSDARSDVALLQAIAAGELAPPSRVARVPADVEAIIQKATRREPAQRYASVAELADDLRRWRASQPVRARRGSVAYRVRRFAWRNRYGIAAAFGAALLLSAFVAAILLDLWQARAQRERADRINEFFNAVLAAGDPSDMGRSATVVEALERAQQRAARELAGDPASAMLTELTLARTLQQLGRYDAALPSAHRAVDAARRAGDTTTEIDARLVLGTTLWNQGRYDEASAALQEARARAEADGSAQQRGEIANRIGEVEFSAGRPERAREWQQRALELLPRDATKARAYALGDLASVEYRQGDVGRALELNAQSIALLRADQPRGSVALATQLGNRGAMFTRQRRFAEAERVLEESLAMKIELYGESHRIVVDALTKLAQLRIDEGDFAGALGYAGRGYALARPMANYVTARAAKKYASALGLASRTGEALPLAREAVALYEARYPPGYNELLDAQSVLGWLEALAGDVVAGRARAQSAYETLVASAGAQDSFAIEAKRRLDAIASARVEPAGGAPR